MSGLGSDLSDLHPNSSGEMAELAPGFAGKLVISIPLLCIFRLTPLAGSMQRWLALDEA